MPKSNGSIVHDPRIDRGLSWVLGILVVAALGWFGSEVTGLREEVIRLRVGVADLTARVSLLERKG